MGFQFCWQHPCAQKKKRKNSTYISYLLWRLGWSWDIEQANAMEMEFVVVFWKSSKIGNLTQLTQSFLNFALVPSSFFRSWKKGPKNCRHFSPDTCSHQGNTSNQTSHYVRKKKNKPLSYLCHCYLSFLFHAAEPNPREICTNTIVPVTRITLRAYLHKRTALLSPMGFIKF